MKKQKHFEKANARPGRGNPMPFRFHEIFRRGWLFVSVAVCLIIFSSGTAQGAETTAPVPADHAKKMAQGLELFKNRVSARLMEHCVKCHGGEKTKGDLDLTSRESLLRGGAEGPAIVPGNAQKSRLYKLITHQEEPPMPHKTNKLSDEVIAQIAAWIDTGAPYDKPLIDKGQSAKSKSEVSEEDRQFWSFQPLQPAHPPEIKNKTWCRTPIDQFILHKLEAKGLKPNPPVASLKLVRRVYFDLLGLPPTPGQIDEFLNDRSPNAYPDLIDRLLASSHFGERWARHWLDVARFAESHGFEHDYDRPHAYHFRDFVIKAFNQDLPYDQFVKWQLAGDEFEPDKPLALMATGFLGAGVFPTQITANEVERTRYDALDDMAATMGTAMLGLTVGCARCHDHKFDPIPTRDYYRLLSTFTTTVRSEIDLDLNPNIYQGQKAAFDNEHAPLLAALNRYEEKELPARFEQWLSAGAKLPEEPRWVLPDFESVKSGGEATFTKLDDGSYLVSGKNPDSDTYTFTARTSLKGITAMRVEALAHESLAKGGPGRADNGNFSLGNLRLTAIPANDPVTTNEIYLVNPRATFEQNSTNLSVAAALDGDKKTGWAVDPKFGTNHAAVFETKTDLGFDGGTILTFTLEFKGNQRHTIGRPRLSISTAPRPVGIDGNVIPQDVVGVLAALKELGDPAKLSGEQKTALLKYYRTFDAGWGPLNDKVQEHLKKEPKPVLTKVMVCSEGFKPLRHHTQGADFFKETYFLNRGNTDQKKEIVSQGFLQVLMKSEEKRWQVEPPPNWRTSYRRKTLANWITDTDSGAGHLLARVIVNRLWQHHLGEGLVATPNDFGAQGQRPSHPELLDWLARELIQNGWRLKPIHKLIVTSAVYMQGTQADPKRLAIDSVNQFYWRRTPRRLEAEVIRDSLLSVSGGLDAKMYGPGTLDAESHRRSIYFMIKRSQLIPMMQLFDAPEPLTSIGGRPNTTIAPQALLFLNNPQVRSHALRFAQRLASTAEKSMAGAVKEGYRIALGRPADSDELRDALAFIRQQTRSYASEKKDGSEGLALADFCQVLMSLNEFIYID